MKVKANTKVINTFVNGKYIKGNKNRFNIYDNNHDYFQNILLERLFDRKKKSDFWHIINDKPLELNDYSINTRSKIRRGFKELDVKRINKQELLKYGYSVYIAAFKR